MAEPAQNLSSEDTVVQFENVTFGWRDNLIFDGLDIAIPRGKVTTIMGPSGSGKTTLLRLIGGQLNPYKGSVTVDRQNVQKLSRSGLFKLRKRMGMMFQTSALFTHLTVFENIAFPLREHTALPDTAIRSLVLMKLQAVGLRGARDLMPSELSGGMTRRVALARAIAMDPLIIMYDDPFSGQDPITLGVLMRLIRQLNDGLGVTTIIVSHDVEEVNAISDYLYLIGKGKVKDQGTPEELGRSTSEWSKQFLHGLPDGPIGFHFPAGDYYEDLMVGA
jgi:phospholipid/cholesterol/gamma-HCH transport system ATP-binding protein